MQIFTYSLFCAQVEKREVYDTKSNTHIQQRGNNSHRMEFQTGPYATGVSQYMFIGKETAGYKEVASRGKVK